MQGHFPLDEQEQRRNLVTWAPPQRVTLSTEDVWVPLPVNGEQAEPVVLPFHEARFGFAGSDNRAVSLNIPAEGEDGQRHRSHSFDIEFDPERPGLLTICLMESDQDNFIHATQRSIPFPARILAELLRRRKATAQEIATWQADDED